MLVCPLSFQSIDALFHLFTGALVITHVARSGHIPKIPDLQNGILFSFCPRPDGLHVTLSLRCAGRQNLNAALRVNITKVDA